MCGRQVVGVLSFTSTDPTNPLKPPVTSSAMKHNKWVWKMLWGGLQLLPAQGHTTDRPAHPIYTGQLLIRNTVWNILSTYIQ